MIKNILVAIGDTDYEKNAFEYAGQLAVLLGDASLMRFLSRQQPWWES